MNPKNRKSFMKIKVNGKIFFAKKNIFGGFFTSDGDLYTWRRALYGVFTG
jgi:hypothetical protein